MKYPELRLLDRFDIVVPVLLGGRLFFLGVAAGEIRAELGTNGWQMLVWGFFVSTVVCYTAPTPSTRSRMSSASSATAPAIPAATTGSWR